MLEFNSDEMVGTLFLCSCVEKTLVVDFSNFVYGSMMTWVTGRSKRAVLKITASGVSGVILKRGLPGK